MNVLYETRASAPFEAPSTSVLAPAGGHIGSAPALGSQAGIGMNTRGPTAISGGTPTPEKKSAVNELFDSAVSAIFGKAPPPKSGFNTGSSGTGGTGGSGAESGSRYTGPGGYSPSYSSGGAFHTRSYTTQPTHAAYDPSVNLEPNKALGGWDSPENSNNTEAMTSTPEGQMVESLCNPPPNATAAQPTRQNLSDFVKKAQQAQNPDLVCYLLASQCSDPNWKKRLRALHGIHELLLISFPSALSYFSSQDGAGAIIPLTSSVQALLKTKAQQIIDLVTPYLNNNNINNDNGNNGTAVSTQSGGLFDGTDVGGSGVGSMFEDLEVSSISGGPPSGGDSAFSFLDSNPVTPSVTDTPPTISPIQTPVVIPTQVLTPPTTNTQSLPQQPANPLLGINLNATGVPGNTLSGAGIQALYYQSNPALLHQQQMLAMGLVQGPYYGVSGVGGIGPVHVGVGFGGVSSTTVNSGGFEFVDSTAAKQEDPFSFVKIGQ